MPPICDECGSSDVARRAVGSYSVSECGLCGHLQGDDGQVAAVLELRRAEECGVSVEFLGLVEALESIPGLTVERRISLVAPELAPPAVFFTLQKKPLDILDRLARTLTAACRHTSVLWTLEATHQGTLMFVLRPRLFHPPGELSPQEEGRLRADVSILRDALRRDLSLSWWAL